jgi:methionyl aminopeptidase
MIVVKDKEEISAMKALGSVCARMLGTLKEFAKPGVATIEIDELCQSECQKLGVRAGSFGYHGYPGHLCISLNETVIHGIPGQRRIKPEDMVSLDLVIERDGLFVDSTITFVAGGKPSPIQEKLMFVCQKSLEAGIQAARPGNRIGDIGFAVQQVVESAGFSVVREFVGHGVGRAMHEDPQIPNFGKPGTGHLITPGMTLAIEPMIAAGTWRVKVERDGWTANMSDGKPSCHFEHTVAVLETETVVLTI